MRNYSDKDVSDEIIKEIIRAGTYAPTAVNKQLWRFVVVKNRQLVEEYDDRAKKAFFVAYNEFVYCGRINYCKSTYPTGSCSFDDSGLSYEQFKLMTG